MAKRGITLPRRWKNELLESIGDTRGWLTLVIVELKFAQLRPWTPSQHKRFPGLFRVAVRELLLVHARLGPIANQHTMEITNRESATFGYLPMPVLHLIFAHLARSFAAIPITDFLVDLGLPVQDVDELLQLFAVRRNAELMWALVAYHSTWDLSEILLEDEEDSIHGAE